MRENLVIRVKDSDGNFLAVLKSKRRNAIKGIESSKFEAMRDAIVNDNKFLENVATGVDQKSPIQGVSVKRVMVGHPNFNFVKNTDGTVAIESTQITAAQLSEIEDMGYVKSGEASTRSNLENFDRTFLRKALRMRDGSITPFVVLKKGNRKIAYPVTATPRQTEGFGEFEQIFTSLISPSDKAAALNTYMASRGIDIKEAGNSFVGYGETNLNQEFFGKMLAKMESIQYFHDFNNWTDPAVPMEQILDTGVMIDINIKNPFHSPKLQLDFQEVGVEITPVEVTEEEKAKVDKKISRNGVENFKNFIEEDCE